MKEPTLGSIWENFESIARRTPDKTALIYLGTRWTYGELKELAEKFAATLYKLGIKQGDKAIIYLPNIPQWLVIFLALQRINATVVAVASVYTPIDLKYMVNDSGAKTLFCVDTNFGYATQVLDETELERVIVTTMVEMLPWWKRFLGKAFDRVAEGKFLLGDNIFSFKKLLRYAPSPLPPITNKGGDIAVMLYTGGTTGLPKGVPYANETFLESAILHRKISQSLIPIGEGIILQGGPLYHNLGIINALVCLTLAGETLILTPRVNLDAYFEIIQRYKVTNFFGVPALFRMILDHDRIDYYNLSSLKYIFTGGDVLPQETVDRWNLTFHQRLYEAYGITETCGGVAMTSPDDNTPVGSTGRIFPTKTVKFVDPDTLEPVPPGKPGEILVHSPKMVSGYWNKPDETRACFVEIDGKLFYRTKDVMLLDENGWLFFQDRSADMIKHKGYRVAASEIERVLQEHPAVTGASVVGIPDEKIGERIKAFVVLREDVRGVSSYDLLAWCREGLASYKVPQYIEFRDMLPKSKVGKVLRRELRADERKKLEKD